MHHNPLGVFFLEKDISFWIKGKNAGFFNLFFFLNFYFFPFEKRTSLFGSKKRMLEFFYSISKQGTKVFFFFFLGGGGGGWGLGGGGDKERVLKGNKNKLV